MALTTQVKNQTISIGDTLRVYQKIIEEGKTRSQAFEGVCIAIKGRKTNKSFTVRRIASGGIGVERIWPTISPNITRVKIIKKGKVRRAKLYYLRERTGKLATKVKEPAKETKASEKKTPREKG
jgi:large subunit ribosomal protein L19